MSLGIPLYTLLILAYYTSYKETKVQNRKNSYTGILQLVEHKVEY